MTLLQREKERKELARRKKENEAKERKERLEVCRNNSFQRDITLTPLQNERKQRELEREKEEKEDREQRERLEVCCALSLPIRYHCDSIAEGTEAKGAQTREEREEGIRHDFTKPLTTTPLPRHVLT